MTPKILNQGNDETEPRSKRYVSVRRVLLGVLIANLSVTVLKIVLGLLTGALAVVADGFHSLVDSSSNLIGLAAIRLAERPPDERHPYGYRRYETLGALAIGGLLLAAAWEIGRAVIERLLQGGEPKITLLTLGLVILSFPVNVLIVIMETRAGRRLNSEILIADATHTKSDLYITVSVIVSLVAVWFGWVWLDILVASIVVVLIIRASFGILRDAAGGLADEVGVDPPLVKRVAHEVSGVLFVHQIRSRGTKDSVFVDLHVKVDPVMSTSQAHAIASEVERSLVKSIPSVVDALVHIEPAIYETPSEWEQIANDLRRIAYGMGMGLHDLHIHIEEGDLYSIELHLEMGRNVSLGQAHELAEQFELRVKERWNAATNIITHLEPLPDRLLQTEESLDSGLIEDLKKTLYKEMGEENVLEVQARRVDGHPSVAVRLQMTSKLSLVEAHSRAEEIERDLLLRFPELLRVTVHVEPN